jgi:hypothetical protein
MNSPSPKDAAAVILLRAHTDKNNPEVFWVKRNPKLVFLGGFYAFPGGKAEPTDVEAKIENSDDDRERGAKIEFRKVNRAPRNGRCSTRTGRRQSISRRGNSK